MSTSNTATQISTTVVFTKIMKTVRCRNDNNRTSQTTQDLSQTTTPNTTGVSNDRVLVYITTMIAMLVILGAAFGVSIYIRNKRKTRRRVQTEFNSLKHIEKAQHNPIKEGFEIKTKSFVGFMKTKLNSHSTESKTSISTIEAKDGETFYQREIEFDDLKSQAILQNLIWQSILTNPATDEEELPSLEEFGDMFIPNSDESNDLDTKHHQKDLNYDKFDEPGDGCSSNSNRENVVIAKVISVAPVNGFRSN